VCVFVVWIVTGFLLFDILDTTRREHKIQSQSGNTTIDSREYQFMLRCKCNVEREREKEKMRVYSVRCKQTANRREKTNDDDGRRKKKNKKKYINEEKIYDE